MIQQAIKTILTENDDVAGLVGDRIAPLSQAQFDALPFITYRIADIETIDTHSGSSGFQKTTFEIECFAESYKEAASLSLKVKLALGYYKGSVGSNDISVILSTGNSELSETPLDGTEIPVYRLSSDYLVLHKE